MRRRQKWAQDRAQGFGPGLQRNVVSAEQPQAPLVRSSAEMPMTYGPIDDDAPLEAVSFAPIAVQAEYACPKCGRVLNPRGRHFHIRACQGAVSG